MAKESTMKWKLGMFVSIALVLLIAALYFIGTQKNLFGSDFHLRAIFSSVSGLKTGSNVRFGGINVGTVDGIDLKTDTTVIVDMTIKKGVQKFIKKDAIANISSDGLMGEKVVLIAPGSANQQPVAENQEIRSNAPVETDQILSSLKLSADNAAVISQQLSEIVYKINKGHGVISRLIGDSVMSNNLEKTVVNLKKGSQGLNQNMEAAKHNFLLRGYFKKKKKEEEKKKDDEQKKKEEEEQKVDNKKG